LDYRRAGTLTRFNLEWDKAKKSAANYQKKVTGFHTHGGGGKKRSDTMTKNFAPTSTGKRRTRGT